MTVRKIDCISDGGHLLRGTPDLTEEEARAALVEHYREVAAKAPKFYEVDDCFVLDPSDAETAVARERCEVGLFRKSPCFCGEHGWHMQAVGSRGPGVFTAAYFTLP